MAIPVPPLGRIFKRKKDAFDESKSFYLYGYCKNGVYVERWLSIPSIVALVGQDGFDELIDSFASWELDQQRKKDAASGRVNKKSCPLIPENFEQLKEKFVAKNGGNSSYIINENGSMCSIGLKIISEYAKTGKK